MGSVAADAPLAVVWDDRFLDYDFGPSHPFTERSRGLAVRLAEAAGLYDGAVERCSNVPPLTDSELARFHNPEYLELVRRLDRRGRGEPLDIGDTPSFRGCHAAAARIAAGTVLAADRALARPSGRGFQPAGGLHHAHADRASGFCIYNDLALAILRAFDSGPKLRRVAYLDIDVHHGDGVMYGFYGDGRLLDIDLHQDGRTIFPGTGAVSETGTGDGAGLKVNLPLPPGAGDPTAVALLRTVVEPILTEFRPELIVVQHGVDGQAGDGLGQLEYTDRTYRELALVLERVSRAVGDVRLLVTGGGGYTAEHVAVTLARTALRLAGREPPGPDEALPAAWTEEFRRTFGRAAPERWGTATSTGDDGRVDPVADRLAAAVGAALGRRFRGSR